MFVWFGWFAVVFFGMYWLWFCVVCGFWFWFLCLLFCEFVVCSCSVRLFWVLFVCFGGLATLYLVGVTSVLCALFGLVVCCGFLVVAALLV